MRGDTPSSIAAIQDCPTKPDAKRDSLSRHDLAFYPQPPGEGRGEGNVVSLYLLKSETSPKAGSIVNSLAFPQPRHSNAPVNPA